MKHARFKQLLKATTLAILLSSAATQWTHANDGILAVVGDGVILNSDLSDSIAQLQQQLQAQNKALPPAQFLAQQALEQLIVRQAQLQQVKRYNVQVDEQMLNTALLSTAKQAGHNSLQSLQSSLDAERAGSYAALRERVSEEVAIAQLRQQIVMSRIKISDQDIENFLSTPQGQANLGTQVHVLHLHIDGANAEKIAPQVRTALRETNDIDAIVARFNTDGVSIKAADMGMQSLSTIPVELAARISPLQQGQTTEAIRYNDSLHLLKLLERKTTEQKVIVPQYQTRHILIKPTEVLSLDNAKQMIDSLYQRAQAGEDFAVLAATFSNDPGSAADGGNLGWVNAGVMVPEFETVMKNTATGVVSAPFQSQFGWHILQVTDTRQHDMTLDYQKRMARQTLGERQFENELDGWLREIRSNTFVEIKDPRLDPKAK